MGTVRKDIFNSCLAYSSYIGDYNEMTINDLAAGLVLAMDEDDEDLKNAYLSALILKFWSRINKILMDTKAQLHTTWEDCYGWVAGAILQACDKNNRSWMTDKKLNAQQVINQILSTRFVAQARYEATLQKNQANYNMEYLDDAISEDDGDTKLDMLADKKEIGASYQDNAHAVIQDFINRNKIVEAIILDTIAYNDCERHEIRQISEIDEETGEETKYKEQYRQFYRYRVVQILGKLPEDYLSYFMYKYKVNQDSLRAVIDYLGKCNNQKLYKELDSTLEIFGAQYN